MYTAFGPVMLKNFILTINEYTSPCIKFLRYALAVRARHVDDRGSSGRDLVVGLAQQSLVGAERAERRIAAAPAGPRAAAAAVRAVVVGLAGEDRVAVGARIGGAADGVAARRLVADGGDEGGVVVEALVALFGGLLGCSLRRESAHLLEVGDGFFGGSARCSTLRLVWKPMMKAEQ